MIPNSNDPTSSRTQKLQGKLEINSSKKIVKGIRQANVNEDVILAKYKNLEGNPDLFENDGKKDHFIHIAPPVESKANEKTEIKTTVKAEKKAETITEDRTQSHTEERAKNNYSNQIKKTLESRSENKYEAKVENRINNEPEKIDKSSAAFIPNLLDHPGTADANETDETFDTDLENDQGKPLLIFEQPQNINSNNSINRSFLEEDETAFPQTRISRTQRKIIKTMQKEEEERPMIFFDKNNITPFEEQEGNSDQEESRYHSEDEIIHEEEDIDSDMDTDSDSDSGTDPSSGSARHDSVLREIVDWTKHIAIAVAIGLLLVIFVVQRNVVVGSSMEPNLYDADQLFVEKVSKLFEFGITYGDIITINAEGLSGHTGEKNIIKRVIGVPGDKVDINDDGVYRNGIKLVEAYLDGVKTDERNESYSHVTLSDNQYYVLGDNRSVSLDSRVFGPVSKSRIIGEVLIRFYPLDKIGRP